MWRQIFCLGFLLICSGALVSGQATRKVTLLVSECQKQIPDLGCDPTARETVAYHFIDGIAGNREVLMTGDRLPFEFRFPGDAQYVYQNRYLISDGGDVYDFQNRKIVFRNNDGGYLTRSADWTVQNLGVVKVIGDKLFVRLAVSDAEETNREEFYAYDLKTNGFSKIRNAGEFPELRASNFAPGDKMLAVVEKMRLVFYAVDGAFNFKKLKSVSLSGGVVPSEEDDDSSEIPIVWIDKQSVLTQNIKGELIRIDTGGKVTPVLKLKNFSNEGGFSNLTKDKFGNFLLYPCGEDKRTCSINLSTRKLAEIDCPALGNAFTAAFEKKQSNKEFWQYDFFYKGKSIGKNRGCFNAQTTKGYLAVEYGDRNKKTAGVYVWNDVAKLWTTIELKWHAGDKIIGWIE